MILFETINNRAQKANVKVKNWLENFALEELGTIAEQHLARMKPDFAEIVKDPNHSTWGGNYDGFTPDEIKELYFVLYGEELNEEK